MSITDELRKYISGMVTHGINPICKGSLLEFADCIDTEYEDAMREAYTKGRNDGFDCGFASADDWCSQHEDEMEKHGWVKLPKDADGEYIHIGDRMENNERVARIVLTDDSWEPSVYLEKLPNFLNEYFCSEVSHYHAPTVEDVLREMLDKWGELPSNMTNEAIVAEYAKKLALRGDAE